MSLLLFTPLHEGIAAADLVFTGALSFAGLVLVFLGVLLGAYASFEPTEQTSVKAKYRQRVLVAFWGFTLSVVCAVCALLAELLTNRVLLYVSLALLAGALVLMLIVAIKSLDEVT